MNERVKYNLAIAVWGTIIGMTLGMILIIGTMPKADAAQPYGGCAEAWQAPHSAGAQDCRDDQWLVASRYVVSPRGVLRYVNLPVCRNEDGSGNRGTCSWNVEGGNGNGHGLAYLVVKHRHYHDTSVYLQVCKPHHRCKPNRR